MLVMMTRCMSLICSAPNWQVLLITSIPPLWTYSAVDHACSLVALVVGGVSSVTLTRVDDCIVYQCVASAVHLFCLLIWWPCVWLLHIDRFDLACGRGTLSGCRNRLWEHWLVSRSAIKLTYWGFVRCCCIAVAAAYCWHYSILYYRVVLGQ